MTPKFLIADSSQEQEKIYVVHTQYPKFILEVTEEEIEWWDEIDENEESENVNEIEKLISEAFQFYDSEMEEISDNE